jgi:hypothetical protein
LAMAVEGECPGGTWMLLCWFITYDGRQDERKHVYTLPIFRSILSHRKFYVLITSLKLPHFFTSGAMNNVSEHASRKQTRVVLLSQPRQVFITTRHGLVRLARFSEGKGVRKGEQRIIGVNSSLQLHTGPFPAIFRVTPRDLARPSLPSPPCTLFPVPGRTRWAE